MTARMRMGQSRALLWLGGALSALVIACGGSAPKHKAAEPAAYPAPSPTAAQPGGYGQPDQPDQPAPPPKSYDHHDRKLETVNDAEGAMADDERLLEQLLQQPAVAAGVSAATCQRVCAALASMRRSVEALCELTGEDDERCERARQRLESNERRVAGAGCSC